MAHHSEEIRRAAAEWLTALLQDADMNEHDKRAVERRIRRGHLYLASVHICAVRPDMTPQVNAGRALLNMPPIPGNSGYLREYKRRMEQ